ncbi:MAG: tetratricopeptide repeat protein, partial [Bdellovibrionales bacterium]
MTSQLLQQALAAHQRGDLDQAEALYREILAVQPDHIDVLSLLGVLCSTRGDHEQAVSLSARAVELDSHSALLYLRLGDAQMNAERLDAAIESYRKAMELAPSMPDAPYHLGNALRL